MRPAETLHNREVAGRISLAVDQGRMAHRLDPRAGEVALEKLDAIKESESTDSHKSTLKNVCASDRDRDRDLNHHDHDLGRNRREKLRKAVGKEIGMEYLCRERFEV